MNREQHLTRHLIIKFTISNDILFLVQPGFPESLYPTTGKVYPYLESIPDSLTHIAFLNAVEKSSDHSIRCSNPNNFWGKFMARTRLLRRAVIQVYNLDTVSGWNAPKQESGGYVDSLVLTPLSITFSVFS